MKQTKAQQYLASKCSEEQKNGQNQKKKRRNKSSKTLRGSAPRRTKNGQKCSHEKNLTGKKYQSTELERQCPEEETNG